VQEYQTHQIKPTAKRLRNLSNISLKQYKYKLFDNLEEDDVITPQSPLLVFHNSFGEFGIAENDLNLIKA
jgi:hypothetical protein